MHIYQFTNFKGPYKWTNMEVKGPIKDTRFTQQVKLNSHGWIKEYRRATFMRWRQNLDYRNAALSGPGIDNIKRIYRKYQGLPFFDKPGNIQVIILPKRMVHNPLTLWQDDND